MTTNNGVQNMRALIEQIEQTLPQAEEAEQARLYHHLGTVAYNSGDVRRRALQAFIQMRRLAVKLGDQRLEAVALNGLSCVHDSIGLRTEALGEALRAEQLATEIGDQRLVALALNHQAQYYKEAGQSPTAFQLFERIRAMGIALHDDQLVMAGTIGLGRATPMSEPEQAIAYYEEALRMAEALDDQYAMSICYNNLADWQVNTGHYAESILVREKGQRISQELGFKEGIGRALLGIGKAHTLMGHYDIAWKFLNTALPTILSAGDFEGELHCYLNLAYLYLQKDDILRACDYYQQALEKSLAAPDTACAIFAQRALDLLAEGLMPPPALLPPEPLTPESIKANPVLAYTYPTNDQKWGR